MVRVCQSCILVGVLATPALAQNIALNKPVTVVSGAGSQLSATSPGVITDGLFLSEATNYSAPSAVSGSVRWNTGLAGPLTLEIQLGDLYSIDGIIVQADDNDSLLVTYLASDNTFQPLYSVASVSTGAGFVTRPNGNQTTYAALTPVQTTTIRVTNGSGDNFFGISELQLRGVIVPAPASVAVLGGAGLVALRRRRA